MGKVKLYPILPYLLTLPISYLTWWATNKYSDKVASRALLFSALFAPTSIISVGFFAPFPISGLSIFEITSESVKYIYIPFAQVLFFWLVAWVGMKYLTKIHLLRSLMFAFYFAPSLFPEFLYLSGARQFDQYSIIPFHWSLIDLCLGKYDATYFIPNSVFPLLISWIVIYAILYFSSSHQTTSHAR